MQSISEPQPKKKRQCYGNYGKIQREIVHGVTPAARKLAFLSQRYEELSRTITLTFNLESIEERIVARKTLLPFELDDKALRMIKNMRQPRCVVNFNIAIAVSKRIVLANDRTLLKENGGSLNLDFSWCQSIFRRIGFTKRRATTAKQPVSSSLLKEMGFPFHRAVKKVVDAYDIPDDLVINIDEIPLPFILLSK